MNEIANDLLTLIGAAHQGVDIYENIYNLTEVWDIEDLVVLIDGLANIAAGLLEAHPDPDHLNNFLIHASTNQEGLFE